MRLTDLLALIQCDVVGVRFLQFDEACVGSFDGDSELVKTLIEEILNDIVGQAVG